MTGCYGQLGEGCDRPLLYGATDCSGLSSSAGRGGL